MSAENNVYLNATLRTEKNFATPLLWDGVRTILILFLLEILRRNWYQNRESPEHLVMNRKIPFLPPLFPNAKSS